jgi:hypothetical protein
MHLKHGATEQRSKNKEHFLEKAFLRLTLWVNAVSDVKP